MLSLEDEVALNPSFVPDSDLLQMTEAEFTAYVTNWTISAKAEG